MSEGLELAKMPEAPQFNAAGKTRLARRKLGRWTMGLLVLLRIYVVLAVVVVAYEFIRALGAS